MKNAAVGRSYFKRDWLATVKLYYVRFPFPTTKTLAMINVRFSGRAFGIYPARVLFSDKISDVLKIGFFFCFEFRS